MTDELLAAITDRPFCLSCLKRVTVALERDSLIAMFAGDIKAAVDVCGACKRDTQTTYRFRLGPTTTAEA